MFIYENYKVKDKNIFFIDIRRARTQYLEMRFGKFLRQMITAIFVISIYMALPVVIFVPALAFSQLTDINIHVINACICCVCVIYTMLVSYHRLKYTGNLCTYS